MAARNMRRICSSVTRPGGTWMATAASCSRSAHTCRDVRTRARPRPPRARMQVQRGRGVPAVDLEHELGALGLAEHGAVWLHHRAAAGQQLVEHLAAAPEQTLELEVDGGRRRHRGRYQGRERVATGGGQGGVAADRGVAVVELDIRATRAAQPAAWSPSARPGRARASMGSAPGSPHELVQHAATVPLDRHGATTDRGGGIAHAWRDASVTSERRSCDRGVAVGRQR